MSRTIRAMLFVLLALVAGTDFLLQHAIGFDQDGFAAKHRPTASLLSAALDDDGDEHLHPEPNGGGLGGALLVLLALVLCGSRVGAIIVAPPAFPSIAPSHVRVPEPRGPPLAFAGA